MTRTANTRTVFRVQAADGRGPWRPGLSRFWADDQRTYFPTDVISAFGITWKEEIPYGWHAGCACSTLDKLLEWFTPLEQRRLESMGYMPVTLMADRIIRENDEQVIFARRDPLNVGVVALCWRVRR
jgi:hypothetical protein